MNIKLNRNFIDGRWAEVENTSCGGRRAKKYCNYFLEKRDDKNYYFVEKVNFFIILLGILTFMVISPFILIYLIGLGITKIMSPLIETTTSGRMIQDSLNGLFHKGVIRDDHLYAKDITPERYGLTLEQIEKLTGVKNEKN